MEANIIDFICYIRLLTRISFSFLTTMLKKDIMKKAEINHFFTISTLGIQFQGLFALMFGLMMQRGWEEWAGLRLLHCWQSTDAQGLPPHMCLKWGTSPIMNGPMMITMDILSVSTLLESGLTRILDREKQIKTSGQVNVVTFISIKRGHWDIYQSQVLFMKSWLLSKNSDLITLGEIWIGCPSLQSGQALWKLHRARDWRSRSRQRRCRLTTQWSRASAYILLIPPRIAHDFKKHSS